MLMSNIGRVKYPQYDIQRTSKIFRGREDLIRYVKTILNGVPEDITSMTCGPLCYHVHANNINEISYMYINIPARVLWSLISIMGQELFVGFGEVSNTMMHELLVTTYTVV